MKNGSEYAGLRERFLALLLDAFSDPQLSTVLAYGLFTMQLFALAVIGRKRQIKR